ncbi:hypothetical protein K2X05_01525 [bacterium]|nr:hypothetical protein [bacterium]
MHKLKWSLAICALFTSLVVGCKSNEDEDSSSNSSVVPGVIDASGGFNVKVNPPVGTNYFIHKAGDFDATCTVASNETVYANKDITCIVEVEELEGAFNGISMVMNAPPAMCKYVNYYPYFYFGLNYGAGPTAATVRFDKNSTFVGGSVTGPGFLSGTGEVKCNYSYKDKDCCYGSYTKTTTNNFGSTDPDLPPTTTSEVVEWSGKPGDCAVSPAEELSTDEASGVPVSTYYYSTSGFNKEFATKKRSVIDSNSSLFYANYYSGTAPTAFKLAGTYPGNPYYQWVCVDDAEEIVARIRVQIREWNDIDEFVLKASGNPDTTGTETDWTTPINDFNDWLDIVNLGNGYPGIPK